MFPLSICGLDAILVLLAVALVFGRPIMRSAVDVAVIGAGPYGLSVAAHLSGHACEPRIFGRSMETWRSFMPKGMVLKSEGFAMSLSEPTGEYTLAAYCRDHSIPYQDVGWPVPLETFAAYGEAFQRRFVPQLEPFDVTRIERSESGFDLQLETGERLFARHVVMATGIRPYSRLPDVLADAPGEKVTHSAEHGDMSQFEGRHVAVLGGGASAMDVAAALHRAGATASVITRRPDVRFYPPGSFRSMRDSLLAPMTPLGPGWKKYLCVKLPDLFHALPERTRIGIVNRYLGPSPAWSVRDIVQNHVDVRLNATVTAAHVGNGTVTLSISKPGAGATTLDVDHVISATGYDIDIDRSTVLSEGLRKALGNGCGSPRLSPHFESGVSGLYFVGTPAAMNFGPMLRFVCGAEFAARRLSRHIARRVAIADMADSAPMPLRAVPFEDAARGSVRA